MRMVPILIALSLSAPVSAQKSLSFVVTNRSQQPLTCAEINGEPPEGPVEVRRWVLGFWSGLNAAEKTSGGGFVGATTNSAGVYSAVRQFCKSNPEVALEQATFAARYDMKSKGQ